MITDRRIREQQGSISILAVGVLVGVLFLVAILATIGGSYVAHAELQQAADIAATSIERSSADSPRERATALARTNGATSVRLVDQSGSGLIKIIVQRRAPRLFGIPAGARLEAVSYAKMPEPAMISDGGPNPPGFYSGPLVYVDGVPICPRVGAAYRAMDAAAARDGVSISASSGFRGYAEQAALYAALGPAIAAPPGVSRHHDATEFDLNVGAAGSTTHAWLTRRAGAFGFVQRYSWEPWHWGFVAGC